MFPRAAADDSSLRGRAARPALATSGSWMAAARRRARGASDHPAQSSRSRGERRPRRRGRAASSCAYSWLCRAARRAASRSGIGRPPRA
eukprot:5103093-Alexandrium_andersonii.AAC.1